MIGFLEVRGILVFIKNYYYYEGNSFTIIGDNYYF